MSFDLELSPVQQHDDRPVMNMKWSYIKLDNLPATEEYHEEIDVTPVFDEELDLLSWEIRMTGIPEHWLPELRKHPSGFYRVDFNHDIQPDTSDYDGSDASYPVLNELLKITPSKKARLLYYWNEKGAPNLRKLTAVYQPCWRVDYTYGGSGTSSETMYLPKALWYRFTKPHPWGRCPDVRISRSGY